MKISVFGADGYLGSAVYRKLKETDAHEVTGTSFNETTSEEGVSNLDITQPEAFSRFYKQEQADVIIWTLTHPLEEDRLIEQGLAHLITHLKPENRLVFISSADVFAQGEGPYNEEDKPVRLQESHPKAYLTNLKIKAEYLVSKEVNNYVIIRSGPVYGENGLGKTDKRIEWLKENLDKGNEIERRSDVYRSFTHVDDMTDFIIEMTLKKEQGIFHATSGQQDSYYTFYRKMAEQYGFNPDLVKEQAKEEKELHLPENMALTTLKTHRISNVSFRRLKNAVK